ncbi:MAG: ABC transporter substrate-binding protein [Clostridiales bacterium]|jgi:ABC-type nitrate/sulfonate/bicarbonate transport system substrate-binding protein|nr:ABC transporter substrate-binding protein [Clostridiales bacterium]
MKKTLLIGVTLFSMIFSGCGPSRPSNGQPTTGQPTAGQSTAGQDSESGGSGDSPESYPAVKLRVGHPGSGLWTGIQGLAYKNGFFEEELAKVNATIEVIGFAKSGPEINAALTGKSLDAAIYGDVPATQVKSKGTDTTLLGGQLSDNDSVLAVKPDIKSVSDLKGKRVAAGFGTYMHRILGLFLATGGISLPKTDGSGPNDIEFLNMTNDTAIAAFIKDDIQAFLTSHVNALKMERDSYKILLTSEGKSEWGYTEDVIFRTEYLEENPQVAIAFLKALIRSSDYAKENLDELRGLAVAAGSDLEDVNEAKPAIDDWALSLKATPEFLASLKATTKWLVDEGLSDQEVDIDEWYDASWFEKAEQEYRS